MKKILFTLIAVMSLTLCAQAQSQAYNPKTVFKVDAAGNDTIRITPNTYKTIYRHTLTDSVTYKIISTSFSNVGDELIFIINNSAGGTKFKTIPASGLQVTGADSVLTITASKSAVQTFIFNGTNFIEKSKIVQ